MANLPLGLLILALVSVLFYLGVAQRVLDRLRLTDRAAFLILVVLILGGLLPEVRVAPTVSVDMGGALIPLGICGYLVLTADTRREKVRSVLAALLVAGITWWSDKLFPFEPGAIRGPINLDPIFIPALVAAIVAYLAGRSRRAAFVAAVTGLILTDLVSALENFLRGLPNAVVAIGGGGVFDTVVFSGLLAVVLVEVVGETREWLSRRYPRANALSQGGTTTALGLAATVFVVVLACQGWPVSDAWEDGRVGSYFVMVDEEANMIMSTSRRLYLGDEYISEENDLYEVIKMKGHVATAICHGKVDLKACLDTSPWIPASQAPPVIGLYHTHNAESYVRSDGSESINGYGGIHEVGNALAESLASKGFRVRYSENLHLPHDRGAYRRSRSTALALLGSNPYAIFDIHRDALAQNEYATRVSGEWITQVLMVVGSQNPNSFANRGFAMDLKGVGDDIHPGLIRGILIGRGNYNQDLAPRFLLLEIGSHTNARESAERGALLFSDVIKQYVEKDS